MNKKVYIITIVISILIMIPSVFCSNSITTLLSGIGCSGIAAAIMAIFLDWTNDKREKQKTKSAKNIYFKSINNQLNMLIERILWFDERMDDEDFNWDLPRSQYSSLRYMIFASQISKERTVSYEEAINLLKEIGKKYTLEKQDEMTPEELSKVQKMFLILADSCDFLISEANSIRDNKLALHNENYISLSDTDSLLFCLSLAIGIMFTPKKNYDLAITEIITAAKKIREIGNYDEEIRIGLHGSIKTTEL